MQYPTRTWIILQGGEKEQAEVASDLFRGDAGTGAIRGKDIGKVIAVASGKGGTGKTTTVAAISSCLAALGYRTLCMDFDAGLKNLDLSLCMDDYTVTDYLDVHTGRLSLMEACHEHPRIPNLFFLSAPTVYEPGSQSIEAMRPMYDEVRREFDYCLVDSPPGISLGFKMAHTGADMSIIVTNGELPAVRDAQRAVEAARNNGVSELRLLVNRVLPENFRKMRTTIDDVIDIVGIQLLGIVREDRSVLLSLHEDTPLVLYDKRVAAYDFLDAARRITGEHIPIKRVPLMLQA